MLSSRVGKAVFRAAGKAPLASFHASAARRAMKFDPSIGLTDEEKSIQVRRDLPASRLAETRTAKSVYDRVNLCQLAQLTQHVYSRFFNAVRRSLRSSLPRRR
jgi:hypothetical protein